MLGLTSVAQSVRYDRESVTYRTFAKRLVEVMRVAFLPTRVLGGGRALEGRRDLRRPGFIVSGPSNGDTIVRVRHDDARSVVIR